MGQVLPMPNPLDKIECRFVERKWMRAAKAWRCVCELPTHPDLAVRLTGLIERQVSITLSGAITKTMDPAFIVDVPSKGKKFSLVFETVYENQAGIGPYLTTLTDTMVSLKISPHVPEEQKHPATRNDVISAKELKGLHVGFFNNERFWAYLQEKTNRQISSPTEAKNVFKGYLQVESCKDVDSLTFSELL